jgi:tRNA/rRNA methyltransferase
LVRPQLGENIGKAARAMLNFGLTELRLVAPRDGWPNPDAGPSAAGADQLLADAQIYETTADAVADCNQVYATTVRKRGVTKPVYTPQDAAAKMHMAKNSGDGNRTAILFGPERSGLDADDVALARSIITIPINPDFGSINLAQAVIIIAYECAQMADLAQPTWQEPEAAASQADLDGMIEQLYRMLDERGYFFPEHRTPATQRTLRTLLTQPGWSEAQVRVMRGVLSHLERVPRAD